MENKATEPIQLDLTEIGMSMTIIRTAKDTDGQSLEMEWSLNPHSGGTPVHVHPSAIETYEILSGELQVFKKDRWLTVHVGEKVTIEMGEPHTFKNATNEYVRVYNTHQPALAFEEFFRGLHKFAKSGLVKGGKMDFKSIVGVATLWTNYSREIVSIKPPSFIMKALAAWGRLTGVNFK